MIVAITGGSGYLAQRISDYLLKKNCKIILLTRRNISSYNSKNVKILKINWNNSDSIKIKADVLINTLRTNKLSDKSKKNNHEYRKNILSKISAICNENKISKLIYISSIHVYKNFYNSTKESNSKNLSILNNYAKEKLFFEKNFLNIKKIRNTQVYILRLANCFGYPGKYSGDCWNLYLNLICKNIFKENKVVINNNINTHRNFIPISLVNTVIYKLLISNNKKNIIMNIANDQSTSLIDITNKIIKIINTNYKITPVVIYNNDKKLSSGMNINNTLMKKMRINIKKKFDEELRSLILYCFNKFYN